MRLRGAEEQRAAQRSGAERGAEFRKRPAGKGWQQARWLRLWPFRGFSAG